MIGQLASSKDVAAEAAYNRASLVDDRRGTLEERKPALDRYRAVAAAYPETKYGQRANGQVFKVERLQLGMTAPEIVGKDIDGNDTSSPTSRARSPSWTSGLLVRPVRCDDPARKDARKAEDQPFALVGINSDNEERYRERRPEMGVTWPSFFDGGSTGGPIASQWGVTGWPTIYVLDGEGKIRYEGVRGDAMDRAVDTLLVEMGVTEFERATKGGGAGGQAGQRQAARSPSR